MRQGLLPVLLLLTPLCSGCTSPATRQPYHLILGFDTSTSFRQNLPGSVNAGISVIRSLEPARDTLTLFRADAEADEFLDNAPPTSREKLQLQLAKELIDQPAQAGTRPSRFWRKAAEAADRASTATAIVFFTDGENDDRSPASDQEFRTALQRLAENAKVTRVCVWGISRASREDVRASFEPFGLHPDLRGPDELGDRAALQSSMFTNGGLR